MNPENEPSAILLNRKLVLTALSALCLRSDQRREEIEQYRKMWAKEVWFAEQLWKHVPREAQKQILIDLEVNETDPDFSFYKAAFGEDPKPIS